MLWDLNEAKHLYSLEAGDVVNALVFSPNRYWLCAATASCIKIFDLESKWVGSQYRNLMVMLMVVVSSGQLSTSSSQNVPTPAKSRNQNACRSPGQRMARHCSVVSPMTLSASGALSRNYFVGLVVYYMTCCTLKIDCCCIHVRSRLHWAMQVGRWPNTAGVWSSFDTDLRNLPIRCILEIADTLLVCVLVYPTEVYGDGASGNVNLQLAYMRHPGSPTIPPVINVSCWINEEG